MVSLIKCLFNLKQNSSKYPCKWMQNFQNSSSLFPASPVNILNSNKISTKAQLPPGFEAGHQGSPSS